MELAAKSSSSSQIHLSHPLHQMQDHLPNQKKKTKILDPKLLFNPYKSILPKLIKKSIQKKKEKGTNLPKFFLKIFLRGMPNFEDIEHNERLLQFELNKEKSRTRFHLFELFGISEDEKRNEENELNRRVLKRLLNRNYDNILMNKHIRNKRMYMLFCKKMLLRLNNPKSLDRLQV